MYTNVQNVHNGATFSEGFSALTLGFPSFESSPETFIASNKVHCTRKFVTKETPPPFHTFKKEKSADSVFQ